MKNDPRPNRHDGCLGSWVEAKYRSDELPQYQHNALIEALPAILTKKKVTERTRRALTLTHQNAQGLSAEMRCLAALGIGLFREPLTVFFTFYYQFANLLREGYSARNPFRAEATKQLKSAFRDLSWLDAGYNQGVAGKLSGDGTFRCEWQRQVHCGGTGSKNVSPGHSPPSIQETAL